MSHAETDRKGRDERIEIENQSVACFEQFAHKIALSKLFILFHDNFIILCTSGNINVTVYLYK